MLVGDIVLGFVDFPCNSMRLLLKINRLSEELLDNGRRPQSGQTIINLVSHAFVFVFVLASFFIL